MNGANMEIADGGGVRVYSSLLILEEIMNIINRLEESYLDRRVAPANSSYHSFLSHKADVWLPCHYFDYIGGTGSGGLIAIMLGRLKMNVHESILAFDALLKEVLYHKRWFHHSSLLFWPRAKFNHQILEQAIQRLVSHHGPGVSSLFRSSDFAFDENQCKTIVLAFRRDESSRKRQGTPYLFRTYNKFRFHDTGQRLNRNSGLAHQIPIWQVARATTASPTYFKPVTIDDSQYVSGSFGVNNPSGEICDEVSKMTGSHNVDIILSIGTKGHRVNSLTHHFLELRPGYSRLEIEALGQMEMDEWQAGGPVRTNISSLIGRHRSKKKAATPGQGSQTVIANPDNSLVPIIKKAKINIAEWLLPRNFTAESIRKHTRDYLNRRDVQSQIDTIAKYLVQKRRDRVHNDIERWEKFCYETWYQCNLDGCLEPGEEYTSREALRIHILDKHSDKYSRRDQEALESALDEAQIRVF